MSNTKKIFFSFFIGSGLAILTSAESCVFQSDIRIRASDNLDMKMM